MSTEVTCSRCHLPQHTAQTLLQADASDKKKFCSKLPFQNEHLHDIYGNPFPTISGTAKEKKAAANAAAAADSPTPDPSDAAAPAPKAGKNSGLIYFKCTCCENEKVASVRYAAHLEKCLGLSGRKSSRAAMAKMNSSSGGGSPMLQPADAPTGGSGGKLGGSRKPSPEKKSPVPPPAVLNGGADEIKVSTSISSALPTGAAVTGTATATPKKKKKKAPLGANVPAPIPPALIPHDGLETLDERDRDRERELAPLPPIIKDPTAPPPKKRKRKAEAEGTINLASALPLTSTSAAPDVDLPKPPMKKQKILGVETPGTKKQKFKKQSPAPGAFPKKSVLASPVTVGAPVDRVWFSAFYPLLYTANC